MRESWRPTGRILGSGLPALLVLVLVVHLGLYHLRHPLPASAGSATAAQVLSHDSHLSGTGGEVALRQGEVACPAAELRAAPDAPLPHALLGGPPVPRCVSPQQAAPPVPVAARAAGPDRQALLQRFLL